MGNFSDRQWGQSAIVVRDTEYLESKVHLYITASAFLIIFLAELPDKTMISSIIMGSKLPPFRVFVGASTAFFFQVIISVAVGGVVSSIPKKPLDLLVGVVFLMGAAFMAKELITREAETEKSLKIKRSAEGLLPQIALAFVVTFIAEFGDLTQIVTANLAAKTGSPLSVGLGAFLGLLAVTALAVFVGSRLLSKIPVGAAQVVSALLMTALGLYSISGAL